MSLKLNDIKLNAILGYIPSYTNILKSLDGAPSLLQNAVQCLFARHVPRTAPETRTVPFNFFSLSAQFEKLSSILKSVSQCSFQRISQQAVSSKCLDKVVVTLDDHRKEILVYSQLEKNLQQPSCLFHLNRQELDRGWIGYHNGINTTLECAKTNAIQLSDRCCKGHNIHGTYSATVNLFWDSISAILGRRTILTPGVVQLLECWQNFFEQDQSHCFLQICHSRGTIEVNNALTLLPKDKQQRILVVAVAPACFIPASSARKVVNLVIPSDPIPKMALNRHLSNPDTLMLEGHDDRQFSHYLLGSSYLNVLTPLVDQYIRTNDIANAQLPVRLKTSQGLSDSSIFDGLTKKLSSVLPRNSHARKVNELEDRLGFFYKTLIEKTSESFQAFVSETIACLLKAKEQCLARLRALNGEFFQDPQSLLKKAWDSIVSLIDLILGKKIETRDQLKQVTATLKGQAELKGEEIKPALAAIKEYTALEKERNSCIEQLKNIASTEKMGPSGLSLAGALFKEKETLVQRQKELCGCYYEDPAGLLAQAWREYKNAADAGRSEAIIHLENYNNLEKERNAINAKLFILDQQISAPLMTDRSIEALTTASIEEKMESLEKLKAEEAGLSGVDWKKTAKIAAALAFLSGGYIASAIPAVAGNYTIRGK